MDIKPQILFGNVMHKRIFPKVNSFSYGIYYIALPVSKISSEIENRFFKINQWGLLSFYNRDHGYRNNDNIEIWARDILKKHNITKADGEIILVTMPRVLGYVFNPVSFWYCYDVSGELRTVICEVNNTFGETHSYICVHSDERPISQDDIIEGKKVFHVSPFLEKEGNYKFRFAMKSSEMGAYIDFYDNQKRKKLITVLSGKFTNITKKQALKAFFCYPLVTLKAIFLIHWQAMKLFIKRTEYVPKPKQLKEKTTKTHSK